MSDNTTLNSGSGGDTIRTLQRTGVTAKTEVVQLDVGGGDTSAESLVSINNPLPVDLTYTNELLYRILVTLQSMQLQDANAYGYHVSNAEPSSDEELG